MPVQPRNRARPDAPPAPDDTPPRPGDDSPSEPGGFQGRHPEGHGRHSARRLGLFAPAPRVRGRDGPAVGGSGLAHGAAAVPPDRHHLHLSLAVPGVLTPEKSPAQVDAGASLAMFRVNTLGPLLLMKHFAEFLPRRGTDMGGGEADALPAHATWVFMSARVGSVADNRSGGWFSYRASKAAVNSVAKSLDVMLRARSGDKAVAVAYHPGTVRTGLSREFWERVPEEQLFSPEYAAERMVSVVNGLHLGQRGRCLDWKGEEIPP